jgi:hypothetical protein
MTATYLLDAIEVALELGDYDHATALMEMLAELI